MMLDVRFIVLLLCFALYDAKRDFRCDYTYFPEADGWLKLHEIPTNWHDARLRCQLEGATLASPISAGIGAAMMNLKGSVINTTVAHTKTPISVYTGIHSTYSLKDYSSLEGIPLSQIQLKWRSGSPYSDLVRETDCLVMGPEGGLFGVDGEEAEFPFVCYKKYEKFRINECGTIDNAYVIDEKLGKCYKFHHVARPWRKAYMTCVAEGGHLVVINSGDEADLIKDMLSANKIEPKERKPKEKIRHSDDAPWAYDEDEGEEGAFENIVHVGFTRSEISKWEHRTIDGQTLREAGYNRLGQKHQDKQGLCGAMDSLAFMINVNCNKMWYRFVCEKVPGRTICGED